MFKIRMWAKSPINDATYIEGSFVMKAITVRELIIALKSLNKPNALVAISIDSEGNGQSHIGEQLALIKQKYPLGTRVELIHMDDPYSKLKNGDKGSVTGVDDIGTIFVSWDCGSSLGIVYGEDSCRVIDPTVGSNDNE